MRRFVFNWLCWSLYYVVLEFIILSILKIKFSNCILIVILFFALPSTVLIYVETMARSKRKIKELKEKSEKGGKIIVAIMGSGFKSAKDDSLDYFGMARLNKALELLKLFKDGYLMISGPVEHPKTGKTFAQKAKEIARTKTNTYVDAMPFSAYPVTTYADLWFVYNTVADLIDKSAENSNDGKPTSLTVVIVSEAPHFLRIKRLMAKHKSVDTRYLASVYFIESTYAPIWYWLKEWAYILVKDNPKAHKIWDWIKKHILRIYTVDK